MSKVMSLRLPDDVAVAVEKYAREQDRTQAQVIIRALKWSLGVGAVTEKEPEFIQPPKRPRWGPAKDELPMDVVTPKRDPSMCVHNRERKFCVYCQKTEKQINTGRA